MCHSSSAGRDAVAGCNRGTLASCFKLQGKGWVLLMKLSKNDFCYGSARCGMLWFHCVICEKSCAELSVNLVRWKDGKAFKPEKMLDKTIPGMGT